MKERKIINRNLPSYALMIFFWYNCLEEPLGSRDPFERDPYYDRRPDPYLERRDYGRERDPYRDKPPGDYERERYERDRYARDDRCRPTSVWLHFSSVQPGGAVCNNHCLLSASFLLIASQHSVALEGRYGSLCCTAP